MIRGDRDREIGVGVSFGPAVQCGAGSSATSWRASRLHSGGHRVRRERPSREIAIILVMGLPPPDKTMGGVPPVTVTEKIDRRPPQNAFEGAASMAACLGRLENGWLR